MTLKATGELATSTPTPRATISTCTTRAACCPRIPQMDRRNPAFSELLMVLMAPAPGVKLMRAPAPARASHRENCTHQSYGGQHAPASELGPGDDFAVGDQEPAVVGGAPAVPAGGNPGQVRRVGESVFQCLLGEG